MIIRGKLRGHRWTCTFVENVIGLVKSILMRRWSKKGRGKRRHKLPHALKICNSKGTRSGLASVHQLGINYCVSSCLEELSKRKWKRKWRRVFLGVRRFLLIFIVKIRVLLRFGIFLNFEYSRIQVGLLFDRWLIRGFFKDQPWT